MGLECLYATTLYPNNDSANVFNYELQWLPSNNFKVLNVLNDTNNIDMKLSDMVTGLTNAFLMGTPPTESGYSSLLQLQRC